MESACQPIPKGKEPTPHGRRGHLPHHCEEYLRLRVAARVEQDLARLRHACGVLEADPEVAFAQWYPARLTAPPRVDDLLVVRQELLEGLAGLGAPLPLPIAPGTRILRLRSSRRSTSSLPLCLSSVGYTTSLFPWGAWVSGAYGRSCSCAHAPFPASSVVPIALCLRPAFRQCAVVPPATRPASQPPDGRA